MNGVEHIQQVFAHARQQERAALMPYFTLGYPTLDDSLAVVESLALCGADLIELGVPFSDPLADGPTIQHSTHVALQQGITVRRCLEMTKTLRQRGLLIPLLLMGYLNPVLSYGTECFIRDAVQAGADGLIIPDLPVEEAEAIEIACQRSGLALVYLLAPTSTPERIERLSRHSTGFIYLVSVTGVTGARRSVPAALSSFVARVRQFTSVPLAVGFGISTPKQAGEVGSMVDGVIIGSALIDAVDQADQPAEAAGRFIKCLLRGMRNQSQ